MIRGGADGVRDTPQAKPDEGELVNAKGVSGTCQVRDKAKLRDTMGR
jgi:hypothetical protein